jgi:prepilin-type N-terminal cleavage/methylation domain-containing protein
LHKLELKTRNNTNSLVKGNDRTRRNFNLKLRFGLLQKKGKSRLIHQKGFSLVELIIVIVLIGILALVAVAQYVRLWDESKAAVCKANQFALESAQNIYYTDQLIKNIAGATYASALNDLIPFMDSNTIPTCPLGFQYELLNNGKIRCPDPDHQRH